VVRRQGRTTIVGEEDRQKRETVEGSIKGEDDIASETDLQIPVEDV
jgi:hypothetical protein